MGDYRLHTAQQLSVLLRALRTESGLTQSEVALRLGVTQQTYSALERHADSVSVARLLKLLGILGVELVLSKPAIDATASMDIRQAVQGDKPAW